MAVVSIKSTYTLDPPSVHALESMAKRWGVSKSEALRRAIRAAAEGVGIDQDNPLDALSALQHAANLSPARARAWAGGARAERRASSGRRESGA